VISTVKALGWDHLLGADLVVEVDRGWVEDLVVSDDNTLIIS